MRRAAPSSCNHCLAWGVLSGRRLCAACYSFQARYPKGRCGACHRMLPLKRGYCRLCWCQASLEAKGLHLVLPPFLARIRHHQLFFAGMKTTGRHNPPRRPRNAAPSHAIPAAGRPRPPWVQLALFQVHRDFTRFDRRTHANLASPWLAHARRTARQLGETRGWTPKVQRLVDRALAVLLSGHTDGETICYSQIYPAMRARDLTIERTTEVLQHLGIFHDDRRHPFEGWLAAKLQDLAPGIAQEAEAWSRALHDGGPRSPARSHDTVRRYLNLARPALAHWSIQHQHLREITSGDINAFLAGLHGARRNDTAVVLRSLFAFAKREKIVFRNPAGRLIKPGTRQPNATIQPLDHAQTGALLTTTVKPAARLILALAAVHAARRDAIRRLHLDDLDLGNRQITIAGRTRPLDDLTRHLLHDWLGQRQARWPNTANPHLLINQQTAMQTKPVSPGWISEALTGTPITLEQLRIDRHLDEALTRGPDPLHLAAVFGLSPKTAMRYANAARQLLATPAETTPLPPRPPT
jgi:hypothetical protein